MLDFSFRKYQISIIMGSRILRLKLMGSMKPIEPILTTPQISYLNSRKRVSFEGCLENHIYPTKQTCSKLQFFIFERTYEWFICLAILISNFTPQSRCIVVNSRREFSSKYKQLELRPLCRNWYWLITIVLTIGRFCRSSTN